MKVGILTYHRAHNYGAVLQCFALQETLKRIGHDAYVIDYIQPDIEDEYKFKYWFKKKEFFALKFNPKLVIGFLYYWLSNLCKRWLEYRKRRNVFKAFRSQYLRLTESCSSIPQDFDAYVIGSDMLWDNVCMHGNFEKVYFGDFKRKELSKVIGYAISGTPTSFELCGEKYNFNFLTNFSSVSVREKKLLEIAKRYTDVSISHCIDPTLLAESRVWDAVKDIKPAFDYVLSYFLRSDQTIRKETATQLELLANKEGYKVLDINPSEAISVETFISLIRNAKYIITDSFHGTVFSVIFRKPFNSLYLGDSQDARYIDLLEHLGLSHLAIQRGQTIEIPKINYITVQQSLNEYRKASEDYLISSL